MSNPEGELMLPGPSQDPKETCHPYCGGCGHIYFDADKIPTSQAKAESETKRCAYCRDEEQDSSDSESLQARIDQYRQLGPMFRQQSDFDFDPEEDEY